MGIIGWVRRDLAGRRTPVSCPSTFGVASQGATATPAATSGTNGAGASSPMSRLRLQARDGAAPAVAARPLPTQGAHMHRRDLVTRPFGVLSSRIGD